MTNKWDGGEKNLLRMKMERGLMDGEDVMMRRERETGWFRNRSRNGFIVLRLEWRQSIRLEEKILVIAGGIAD